MTFKEKLIEKAERINIQKEMDYGQTRNGKAFFL